MAGTRVVSFDSCPARVAAIAFDKDGTLIAAVPYWRELLRQRFRLLLDAAGPAAAAEWQDSMGAGPDGSFDRGGPAALGSPLEESLVTATVLYRHTRLPWDVCRERAWELITAASASLDMSQAVRPAPGAVAAVLRLKAAGLKVGVATADSVAGARATLGSAGFPPDLWDFVLGADSVARQKPAPDLIREAARLIGVDPSTFAVVGDARVDMLMARQVGALAVAVREDGEVAPGVAELADVVIPGLAAIHPG